ncbi:hypothetical protein DINM_004304 [Dirofilaria immitis]|nr:hypothetical protein [Dirofilaria immitis]
MSFLLKTDPSLYEDAFPTFDKPSVIGEMCVTKQRDVLPGRCRAKYLHEKLWDRNVCHNADFICWRGTLTRIACSPYECRDGWRLAAVRYKSIIFLCEFPTNEKILQLKSMSDRDKLMTYWGFKFEQYVTSDSLSADEEDFASCIPVRPIASIQVACFVPIEISKIRSKEAKDKINSHSTKIWYVSKFSAAVRNLDFTNCRHLFLRHLDRWTDDEYVELKTQCKELTNGFWRHKAMKWWVQSFLIGIQNIVVGFRDNNGIVTHIERLKVSQLAKKLTNGPQTLLSTFSLQC